MWAFLAALPAIASPGAADDRSATQVLQRVADRMSAKYHMSVAAAFYSATASTVVAAGFTDAGLDLGSPTRRGQPDDLYVWGSTTKMFTAGAVLQLVDSGEMSLDDKAAAWVDPILKELAGVSLRQLFGWEVLGVTLQHLLHMTSGLSDYDGSGYATEQFANRTEAIDPISIVVDYVPRKMVFRPGTRQSYCSTNYVLLGLALAVHAHRDGEPWSWQAYDQASVFAAIARDLKHTRFVNAGTCEQATPVHGFMEGYSTASLPPQDVWNVSCLGGWTAGNYVGSAGDVAEYTYHLYSPNGVGLVSATARAMMTDFSSPSLASPPAALASPSAALTSPSAALASPSASPSAAAAPRAPFVAPSAHFDFYGIGTFNLGWAVNPNASYPAYGHVGDTYGYQSQTTYFPGQDFVISVATNVETNTQAQPADFTCSAYNEVLAAMVGQPTPECTFTVHRHFIGTCECAAPAAPSQSQGSRD